MGSPRQVRILSLADMDVEGGYGAKDRYRAWNSYRARDNSGKTFYINVFVVYDHHIFLLVNIYYIFLMDKETKSSGKRRSPRLGRNLYQKL